MKERDLFWRVGHRLKQEVHETFEKASSMDEMKEGIHNAWARLEASIQSAEAIGLDNVTPEMIEEPDWLVNGHHGGIEGDPFG